MLVIISDFHLTDGASGETSSGRRRSRLTEESKMTQGCGTICRLWLAVALLAAHAVAQDLKVFFGNLHSHTSYSDGSATPDDAYRHARDVAKIDFLAVTEHNHVRAPSRIASDHSLYSGTDPGSVISTATRFNQDGTFVAVYGQEFSSIGSGNHANVFEVSDVISEDDVGNGEWGKLLKEWLPDHLDSTGAQALLLLNHPAQSDSPNEKEYGRDDFPSLQEWRTTLDARAQLINMVNGPSHTSGTGLPPSKPSEGEFLRYLNLGFHLAPTADQDNHKMNWGNATDARTAIIAPTLTKAALLEALRARHVYATTDKNLRLIARINGILMGAQITGSSVPSPGAALNISVDVHDDNEPSANYEVEVFGDNAGGNSEADVVKVAQFVGNGIFNIAGVTYGGGDQYFFLKIAQTDDDGVEIDHAWTAPIWFEPGTQPPTGVFNLSLVVDLAREEALVSNLGSTVVDLSRWVLVSTAGNQRFTFPQNFKLAAGQSVKVTSGPSAQEQPPAILRWTTDFIWKNSGDPGEPGIATGM